jgi:Protein of unknown function (DUF3341)
MATTGMTTGTANVLGVFAHVDTTLQAIRDLRAKGFSNLTVYTPVPIEEIEHEIDKVEPLSKVRLFTVIGALTGTATGFFLTIWTSLKWELVTGGKAPVSIPPFVIIAFELTILLGGLCTLLALFITGPLPLLRGSPRYDPRFTSDRFGVEVHCPPDQVGAAEEILRRAGAEEVRA